MSYQEKKTITTMITNAAVLAAYCLYAFGSTGPAATAPGDLQAWAVAILVFIGIGIAATIVIQVVFHVLLSVAIAVKQRDCDEKEVEKAIKADMVEDERDKLIERKASRFSLGAGGTGFVVGLALLALGCSAAVMLNAVFILFGAGTIAEGFAQLFFYGRGVKHA